MQSAKSMEGVAIIGFGEGGGIFAKDLAQQGMKVSVFDILFNSRRRPQPMLKKARACGVTAE
jgi:3-hydroxyisobutyrate dehydrogenase-like beta-hydroxyacid dehydrogenase